MYTIRIADSIQEVKKDEWDAMTDDNIYVSYGWLKTMEEVSAREIHSKYFLLHDTQRLIGATVCYITHETDEEMNLDNIMFGRLKKYASRLGFSFLPVMVCSPRGCYGKHFLIREDVDPRTKGIVVNQLLEAVETNAREEGLSLCFTNVMDHEGELIRLFRQNRYGRVFDLPLNYLDIGWSSFQGYRNYVKGVSFNTWKKINNQMNINEMAGVVIERLEDVDGCEDRLYELINNNYYKHNRMKSPFKKEFFGKLKENLGKDAVIYIARKKDQLTAVSLLLKRNRVGFTAMVGVDHELAGNDFTYFNIVYYRPIMDAISDQMKRLYFGNSMYELKARRGCKRMPAYIYYRTFNKITNLAVKPWFALLSVRYKSKIPQCHKEIAARANGELN